MSKKTKIKEYLEFRGTKQRWLLDEINKKITNPISETQLSYWISGKRITPSIIKQIISKILNEDVEILFD